jgi:hypothetical protein
MVAEECLFDGVGLWRLTRLSDPNEEVRSRLLRREIPREIR